MIARALDLVIAGVGTVVSAPLVAALALAVRIESRGDPIYRQVRIGRDGEPFAIYKLRTMVSGAEFTGAGLAIALGDDRITRRILAAGSPRPLRRIPRRLRPVP